MFKTLAVAMWASAGLSLGGAEPALDLDAARATDPTKIGWMLGAPPAPDKIIRFADGSFYQFPQWRWSFSHWSELRPTVIVSRGHRPPLNLPPSLRTDLDAVTFVPLGGKEPVTWADSLIANYTDGIVILHRGRMIYERYFGALQQDQPHIAFSVTKSFFGTLATLLIAEGKIDANAPVKQYLPELASSGFGDATVAQVLDMTTALDFVENYTRQSESMERYRYSSGYGRAPRSTAGQPRSTPFSRPSPRAAHTGRSSIIAPQTSM